MENEQNKALNDLVSITEDMGLYVEKTEVQKLQNWLDAEGSKLFGITLAPGCTASAEEIAAEINNVHEHLLDPINNLVSRLSGMEFLYRDASMVKHQVIKEHPFFVPIPLTQKQKDDAKMAELLHEAIAMIHRLQIERDDLRSLAYS